MQSHTPYISQQPLQNAVAPVSGQLVNFKDEPMYCIRNYDHMPPFLMSIVSSSDLWMYLSSRGGLTAGRQHYNNSLFPYETDDKIHESTGITGPKTIVRIRENGKLIVWEPFSDQYAGLYATERNLYKNTPGNKVIFEEINHDLQLAFRYSWMNSDELGWIRKAEIVNSQSQTREIEIMDGLLNLIPWGITRETQSMMSTLMDAYKVSETIPDNNMALYYMSSVPVDRAEPSEALKTNLVWACGLAPEKILLSPKQISNFRHGKEVVDETKIFGQKTAFLMSFRLQLAAGEEKSWYISADVAKDSSQVLALQTLIHEQVNMPDFIEKTVNENNRKLEDLVALADGIQHTGDALNDRRHFANVMFNIMRGGIFEQNDQIEVKDFLEHMQESNRVLYQQYRPVFENQPQFLSLQELYKQVQPNDDLMRLALEYLPLSFSRRHGDPSRPWNFFDIRVKNADGSPSLNYQGNWRDIFQNWEALGFSFPAFLPGMIARFLNASTADGYNPYRITRQGFDWEVPEPDNPWAYIGYWGDHQIIYLLRLMELHEKFFPGTLLADCNRKLYVYARVPYQIKKYNEILQNPQDTIIFDTTLNEALLKKNKELGNDGKLSALQNGKIQKAGFTEKIMVSLLTKLSNFIPGAGIWLNTQRPEWNDANNALVGNGTSMVTLYHLRRFVKFLEKLMQNSNCDTIELAGEVKVFYEHINQVFRQHKSLLEKGFEAIDLKGFADALGLSGEQYRAHVYNGFSGKTDTLSKPDLMEFCGLVTRYIDHTIGLNRREDGLFHAYNLIEFSPKGIEIKYLDPMLEGQAAILNSGILSAQEILALMEALFKSKLWRADQQSFMLYPFRNLPGFLQKNIIPDDQIRRSAFLQQEIKNGNTRIVRQDNEGRSHFNADMKNARILHERLSQLMSGDQLTLTEDEIETILDIYENVFHHRFFTGRSGSFYKYEGLGSIYWHMVSKLLLALGENLLAFAAAGADSATLATLKKYYYRVKEGVGLHKQPQDYGAFPTDPYSHTPSMMGAQQPGMTGQVKEDVLSRFNELGLTVDDGQILFNPVLLNDVDFHGKGECRFTFGSTPFVVHARQPEKIRISFKGQSQEPLEISSTILPESISKDIFLRKNTILKVDFM